MATDCKLQSLLIQLAGWSLGGLPGSWPFPSTNTSAWNLQNENWSMKMIHRVTLPNCKGRWMYTYIYGMQYYMFCLALYAVDEACDIFILFYEDTIKDGLFLISKYSKGTLHDILYSKVNCCTLRDMFCYQWKHYNILNILSYRAAFLKR